MAAGNERAFAIKARLDDAHAAEFAFSACKTMYGGKAIAAGDTLFVFAEGPGGGPGLVAMGTVTWAEPLPRTPGVARETPRVSIRVRRDAPVRRPLSPDTLRRFCDWDDGRPETELNFKFYRQATPKIAGLSAAAARFLRQRFGPIS
jgi:hypothetical protein